MIKRQETLWGASIYDGLQHDPRHAFVLASYSAFKRVVMSQWTQLIDGGLKFVANKDDPYADSSEMRRDVEDKLTLRVYADNGGSLPDDHPMRQKVESGIEGFVVLNDVFRGVHDVMGHVLSGGSFGPKGEQLAWATHRDTMPRLAHNALWCETVGQNMWTNFAGDHESLPMAERPFGEQKAGLVPAFLVEARLHA
ncbi:hypothetical protein [Curtobacterium sp. MCSS17_007]|uniref:hypothetical protein n=1 Tax=Curtobacterium sp. MCSS17_007 TaxID=2175646 RepID=UPI000DAA7C79|nr:hypothetical protein [Curtobacterium sp. MCSS17_007]WIE74470.1 hypothetical protein DEJ22_009260 [Curtobacterium sp. MCSS17_007]